MVNESGYIEYHICGDLLVSGSWSPHEQRASYDVAIIIENGSLIVDDKASISTARTAIVLTGVTTGRRQSSSEGAGKKGTLSSSPPTSVGNPWQAGVLYLDPKLTKDVKNKWGPGAASLGRARLIGKFPTLSLMGRTSSANSKCTKFVMNNFVTMAL